MNIDIRTNDRHFASSLFGSAAPKSGDRLRFDEGIEIMLRGIRRSHSMMEPSTDILSLVVSISTSIAAGVLANWIWDHVKNKKITSISIERTEIEISSKEEILRVLQEKFDVTSE